MLGRGQPPHRQRGGDPVYLHDFALEARPSAEIDQQALARLFEDAFARVFRGEVENDDFNRLVLLAALAAEEVVVLRAYAKYLKQIGFAQSQATIAATLAAIRASRACWCRCSGCASIPRRRTPRAPRRRSTRWSRRWTR